jgi:hypothetical protein
MTNATVDTAVAGVDGQEVTVRYKDGEKKMVIPGHKLSEGRREPSQQRWSQVFFRSKSY